MTALSTGNFFGLAIHVREYPDTAPWHNTILLFTRNFQPLRRVEVEPWDALFNFDGGTNIGQYILDRLCRLLIGTDRSLVRRQAGPRLA